MKGCENGDMRRQKIIATTVVAFGVVYGLINSEPSSFYAGFSSGAAALLAIEIWTDD